MPKVLSRDFTWEAVYFESGWFTIGCCEGRCSHRRWDILTYTPISVTTSEFVAR